MYAPPVTRLAEYLVITRLDRVIQYKIGRQAARQALPWLRSMLYKIDGAGRKGAPHAINLKPAPRPLPGASACHGPCSFSGPPCDASALHPEPISFLAARLGKARAMPPPRGWAHPGRAFIFCCVLRPAHIQTVLLCARDRAAFAYVRPSPPARTATTKKTNTRPLNNKNRPRHCPA